MMTHIVDKAGRLIIRRTQEDDIEFVITAEREEDNAQYVGQWTKEQHTNALMQKDIIHLLIEDKISARTIGYAIIAGLDDTNHCIELKRIVIIDKGKGFGRETLKLIKRKILLKMICSKAYCMKLNCTGKPCQGCVYSPTRWQ